MSDIQSSSFTIGKCKAIQSSAKVLIDHNNKIDIDKVKIINQLSMDILGSKDMNKDDITTQKIVDLENKVDYLHATLNTTNHQLNMLMRQLHYMMHAPSRPIHMVSSPEPEPTQTE